jgi:glycolate oxidase FAD binding subunit
MDPEILIPVDEDGVRDMVGASLANETGLEIMGAGTKRSLGRPVAAEHALTTRALSGITLYEPAELVLRVHSGTLLSHLRATLEEHSQHLAFEPPDWGPLLGGEADAATIGGIVATNQAGPRRFRAGAARDHLLGARMVTGRAEVIKTGGRVVKNVTGYDLCKLLTGSYGTLGVLTEVTLKVLPAPEKIRTVLVFGLDARAAQTAMESALNSPHDVSGAAYLPEAIVSRSGVGYVADAGNSATAFRIEGPEPSVIARCDAVRTIMAEQGIVEELHYHNSVKFWDEVGSVAPFADGTDAPVWRVSLPPAHMAAFMAAIGMSGLSECYADWGGGLIWIRVGDRSEGIGTDDAAAAIIRAAIAACGGHATLIRGSTEIRERVPVFQPVPPALAALTARIKHGFDPHHILNRGRMVEGS